MRWWPVLLIAGCACPQPQAAYQYQQRVPPSVYHAPPSMYSTVLRRNKQGKMVQVRVRNPQPRREQQPPAASAGSDSAPAPPDTEIWTAPDPKIQSDLDDLAGRVEDIRRRMAREPSARDVRQE